MRMAWHARLALSTPWHTRIYLAEGFGPPFLSRVSLLVARDERGLRASAAPFGGLPNLLGYGPGLQGQQADQADLVGQHVVLAIQLQQDLE